MNRSLVRGGLIILMLGGIARLTLCQMHAADLFWHMRVGRDLLVEHLSPFWDHYSFTFPGARTHFVPWIFGVLTYLFHEYLGGAWGIQLLRGILWALPTAILARLLYRRNAYGGVWCLSLALLYFSFSIRSELRPEHLGIGLNFLLLYWIFEAKESFDRRCAFKIVLVLWAWSNYHTSVVIGYVVVGSYYVQAISAKGRKDWFGILGLGLATLLVGFVNPDFTHPLLEKGQLDAGWIGQIQEFAPLSLAALPWPVWLLVTSLVLFSRRLAGVLILLTLGFLSLRHGRILIHFVSVGAFVLAASWNRRWVVVPAVASLAIVVQVYQTVLANPFYARKPEIIAFHSPEDVVAYWKANRLKGNVLNTLTDSGALLGALSPSAKFYLDGRGTSLYSAGFLNHATNVLHSPEELGREVEKYGIDFVIADLNRSHFLYDSALRSGKFGVLYAGANLAILSRVPSPYPIASLVVVSPQALSKDQLPQLVTERALAETEWSPKSPLLTLLRFAESYLAGAAPPEMESSPAALRLAAVLSHREGREPASLAYYRKLAQYPGALSREDALNFAAALCSQEGCRNAELGLLSAPMEAITESEATRFLNAFRYIESRRSDFTLSGEVAQFLTARATSLPVNPAGQLDPLAVRPPHRLRKQ